MFYDVRDKLQIRILNLNDGSAYFALVGVWKDLSSLKTILLTSSKPTCPWDRYRCIRYLALGITAFRKFSCGDPDGISKKDSQYRSICRIQTLFQTAFLLLYDVRDELFTNSDLGFCKNFSNEDGVPFNFCIVLTSSDGVSIFF